MTSDSFRITIDSPGNLDSIHLTPSSRRPPDVGEVEVEVVATALNFKDVLFALGLIDIPGGGAGPFGLECSGYVTKVGPDVSHLRVGDAVVGLGRGCLAQYATLDARNVVRIAESLTMIEAATLPAAMTTADYALRDLGRLQSGERILIHAASGGVGLAALQLSRQLGAEVLATAGSDAKRAFLAAHGASFVTDSRSLAFADKIRDATQKRGVDVVLNSLGGPFIPQSLSVLAPRGRMIELGVRDIMANTPIAMGVFRSGISLCVVSDHDEFPDLQKRLSRIMAQAAPLPHQVFSSHEAARAFQYLAGARHIGKVVVSWTHDRMHAADLIVPSSFVNVCKGTPAAPKAVHERTVNPMHASHANYIRPAEGIEVFERALQTGLPQVVISTTDLVKRLETSTLQRISQLSTPETTNVPSRPQLGADTFVTPRNEVETALASLWCAALGLEKVGIHDDFFRLGGDSLLAVQVLAKARQTLGVSLPPHSLIEAPTIADLAARISHDSPTHAGRAQPETIVCLKRATGKAPLWLIHPIGGQVYIYRDLVSLLPDDQPVYGIRARLSTEPASTIPELATSYLTDILAVQSQGPYLLGGSSFGGVLAYEMARQLVASGRQVAMLAMLDAPGPGYMPRMFQDNASILGYLLCRRQPTPDELAHLKSLSTQSMIAYFLSQASARSGPVQAGSIAELEGLLRLWHTNQKALQAYQPQPYPGSILFFSATEPDGVNVQSPERAWQGLAQGNMVVHPVLGNHISMNDNPNVKVIANAIQSTIFEAVKQSQ